MCPKDVSKDFDKLTEDKKQPDYVLKLFISGATKKSMRAISNIQKICQDHLGGIYQLDVVDISQQPDMLRDEQIVAVPTLIKKLPLPLRRIIGDLSDTEKVLVGLGLEEKILGE